MLRIDGAMIDTIISGATVFDGEHNHARTIDVAIVDDRIALLGDLSDRETHERIDARGLTLAPGFIDTHGDTNEAFLRDGRCANKLAQGVTTEIGGACGSSPAPLVRAARHAAVERGRRSGLDVDWSDLDAFLSAVERSGVGINVATLVGLGTTRRGIRGDAAGRLDETELRAECDLVRAAVEQGALGVSSGLAYAPSRNADPRELVACARVAAAAGAPRYVTHLRDEGAAMLEAVDEAIDVARDAEVALHVSHHRTIGRANFAQIHRSLDRLARARDRGLDVHCDIAPYVGIRIDLDTLLPDELFADGRERALAALDDPERVAALVLRMQLDRPDPQDWYDLLVSAAGEGRNAELAGYRIDEIARMWRTTPARAALRLLREEAFDVEATAFALDENDVATVLSAGFTTIGSEASAAIDPRAAAIPHPSAFGCFPRVFGRFVRARQTLEFGEAIRRMTSLAAGAFGLVDRGVIAPGNYADLVLFDSARIVDTATYERPISAPLGIDSVWVNGVAAVRRGELTGTRAGRALRGGR